MCEEEMDYKRLALFLFPTIPWRTKLSGRQSYSKVWKIIISHHDHRNYFILSSTWYLLRYSHFKTIFAFCFLVFILMIRRLSQTSFSKLLFYLMSSKYEFDVSTLMSLFSTLVFGVVLPCYPCHLV